jgi:HEAT repeat protein
MADLALLPPEHLVPEPVGGRTRASRFVDVDGFAAIAARRKLDERLLDATCAVDGRPSSFARDDLELLLLATAQRFRGDTALLRVQALRALGEIDDDRAVRRLIEVGATVTEHDSARITALEALGDRARELLEELTGDPSEAVAGWARWVLDGRPVERGIPGQVPKDPAHVSDRDHDGCCCDDDGR